MYGRCIVIVVLLGIALLPSSCSECENYYLIMEKKIEDKYYSPIKKENISWTISNIYSNNETRNFDMSCVLNLSCEITIGDMTTIIPKVSNVGTITRNKPAINETEIPINVSSEEKLNEKYTAAKKEDETKENSSLPKNETAHPKKGNENSIDPAKETINSEDNVTKSADIDINGSGNHELNTPTVAIYDDAESEDVTLKEGIHPDSGTHEDTIKQKDNVSVDAKGNKTTVEDQNNTQPSESGTHNNTMQYNDNDSTVTERNEATDKNKTIDNTSKSNKSEIGQQKYNSETSNTLVSNLMAGTFGALAVIGVILLAKIGIQKLIEHCAQSGVYRLPNP